MKRYWVDPHIIHVAFPPSQWRQPDDTMRWQTEDGPFVVMQAVYCLSPGTILLTSRT